MQIEVRTEELDRLAEKMKKKLGDLTPVMRDSANVMHSSVQRNFDEGGRPDKWPDLAESTKKYKTKHKGTPYPMLVFSVNVPSSRGGRGYRTKKLRQSIHPQWGKDYAKVSTNVDYAVYHQEGYGVPKRAFMVWQTQDIRNIEDLFGRYLK